MKHKSKKIIWIVVGCALLLLGFFAYSRGYRVGGTHLVGKVATIQMQLPLAHTSVIVDGAQYVTTSTENETVSLSLSPNTHEVVVYRDDTYPWLKTITPESGEKIILTPLFIHQSPSGVMIGKADPEYWSLRQKISTGTLPAKDTPLVSSDGLVSVWVEEGAILSRIGDTVHTVVNPETPIKNIAFFPNHTDAVIFSTDKAVIVIDVDPTTTQNVMSIYTGTDPYFAPADEHSVYVLDGELLMQVNI